MMEENQDAEATSAKTSPEATSIPLVLPLDNLRPQQDDRSQEGHSISSPDHIVSPVSSSRGNHDEETSSIIDLVLEATRNLHQLREHRDGVPTDVHERILQMYEEKEPGFPQNLR
ncbi:hypothetical protein N7509_012055 [Penicillium cosmopolitanum]|uniref:Uncharacterized protein n=1 Tax=Penicillium cosmopolitanum TaxID=1131564 RepID=A0A9W9SHY5_9EURO|nr:uncharacterized protein N7509_012055 [Penicillium cosmopolitanum]KAJ5378936.1 hypothetical protein N7509_012055 [Penicillium cosmopolitanum]